MQVETFECAETIEEDNESTSEALSLIESLGLSGQQSLLSKKDDGDSVRCPYREMTAEERFVYGTLCPEKVELAKFKASPIPLRVLQVAAHADSLNMFQYLYVWDRVSVTVQDPVLVAYCGKYTFSPDKTFILARWGETLEAFSTLIRQACSLKRSDLEQQAKSALNRCASATDFELIKAGSASAIQHPFT